jgi:hypothetical protein
LIDEHLIDEHLIDEHLIDEHLIDERLFAAVLCCAAPFRSFAFMCSACAVHP